MPDTCPRESRRVSASSFVRDGPGSPLPEPACRNLEAVEADGFDSLLISELRCQMARIRKYSSRFVGRQLLRERVPEIASEARLDAESRAAEVSARRARPGSER